MAELTQTSRWRHELHELAFRTLFRVAAAGGDLGQRVVYRVYFGWLYRRPDPWRYAQSGYEQEKYRRTLAVIRGTRAERALEAGCGEGAFSEMMLAEGLAASVVGVDISDAALARARARCARFPEARFITANLATDAPDGSFDLIVCGETLYYLGGRSANACQLLAERLATGGRIVAVHPADRAEMLHAPWAVDPRLTRERRETVDDAQRPYVIEVFRRTS
jgi:SAM-dependent methyltransferase